MQLSNIYSQLRGDTSGQKNEDSAQGFVRSTTKYWVRSHYPNHLIYVCIIVCGELAQCSIWHVKEVLSVHAVHVHAAKPKAL